MKAPVIAGAVMLAAASAQAADHQIAIKNLMYSPTKVTAKVGDTLTFVNKDNEPHEVYSSTPGFGVNLGDVKGGDTIVMTLRQSGRFDVESGLHPKMAVRVTVTK
jgi:plastocyanin